MQAVGRSLLHWAVMVGNLNIFEAVVEHMSVKCQSSRSSPSSDAPSKDTKFLQLMLSSNMISKPSPMALAISDGAAMKVYVLVKHDPRAVVWTAHKGDSSAITIASNMLKGQIKGSTSKVLSYTSSMPCCS